jgi:hypothetical protein
MHMEHRFQLDGSRRERKIKIDCPYCGAKKSFTRYKDYETGEYLNDMVGMCDRLNKCGQHVKPRDFFEKHPQIPIYQERRVNAVAVSKPLVHIPATTLIATLSGYEYNSFLQPLMDCFSREKIELAIGEYYLGTVRAGFQQEADNNQSAVFWFIDRNNNIRAGQIKLFDEACHTVKYLTRDGEKRNCQTWIHSYLQKQGRLQDPQARGWLKGYAEGEKVTCLFGEHLLNKYPTKPVALVEAPKTAFIASMCYPQYVWLATSSLSYLNRERCRVLKGRRVVLFPDCGIPNKITGRTCLMEWQERVEGFKDIADFAFSALLDERATAREKERGLDLADLILRDLLIPAVRITTEQIQSLPVEVRTGRDFNHLIWATACMNDGKVYDLLFDSAGELVRSLPEDMLQKVNTFFSKDFRKGYLDDASCYINPVIESPD